MTQNDFNKKIKQIYKQEQTLGVKINISQLIDKDHLDCTWYGGEVGSILYKGYTIVIGAYGDIRLSGKINGSDVYIVDKGNYGRAYQDLALDYGVNDEILNKLNQGYPDSYCGDEDNCLEFHNNNWFEVDLISPEGKFIDLCYADNVLENNLLDCFMNIEDYFEYVDSCFPQKY